MIEPERISRFLSYLLRHRPKDYPLVFDPQGFTDWQDIVDIVQERYYDATEDQIRAVVADAQKKRFELRDGKVRATWPSFPVDLAWRRSRRRGCLRRSRDLAQKPSCKTGSSRAPGKRH